MKSRNYSLAVLLVTALLLASCSRKNELKIVETGFGDEIELQQNLLFKFNHDIVNDSIIDKWDSTSVIHFTPQVKGLFKWQSKNELIFSPSGSFKPATTYKSALQPTLLKFFKKGLSYISAGPEFHTSPLKITGNATWWTLTPGGNGSLTLNATFYFNYTVNSTALHQYIKIQVNGKEKEFTAVSTSVSQEFTFKVDGIPKDDAPKTKLHIDVGTGATCAECTQSLVKAISWEGEVSSPEKLSVASINELSSGDDGQMEVQCNQPVDMKDINQYIKITPAINFTTEATESGFIIKGVFANNASYAITILKGLKGMIGGELTEDFTSTISFGQADPSLAFTNTKGLYLSSQSSKKVGVMINNIPKVEVTVFKIYENNIMHFMKSNRSYDYWGEEEESDYSYNTYELNQFGDQVMTQKYETKNLPKLNGQYYLSLNFDDKLPFQGVYLVSVRSADDQWISATKLISISDIGIITKRSNDEIMVFANSIKDAKSLCNVKVTVTSTNNQVLFTGNTDASGVVKFSGLSTRYSQFIPGMISAKVNGDFNYLLMSDSRVETSRYETGGLTDNASGFYAFIYGDREIYRPGDSVYFNTIIRRNDISLQKEVPLKIKLLMPDGREFASYRKTSNAQGAAEVRLQLPASSVTGTWIIEAYTFNDVLVGSRNISVEEFIPDRINVKLEEGKAIYTVPDSVLLEATAVNLFGPPAAGRNYEADFTITRKYFYPKGYEEYNFSLSGMSNATFPNVLRSGKTDVSGKVKEYFSIDEELKSSGMLSGRIFLTVFDETGRPVNRVKSFDIATQSVFYGIKQSDYYNSVGQPLQFGIAAVLPNGKATTSSTTIKFIKVDYHTVLERGYDDRYHYKSQREERVISEKEITIGLKGLTIPFTPNESGEYIVRIDNEGSGRYVETNFYAYRWGATTASSFSVNTEGQVDITLDKEKYAPGDNAKILFKTPFAGRLLITLERNSVIDYYYLNTDKRSAELILPIKEKFLPNIYITATLFRPLDEGTIPLTVGHGIIPLEVEEPSNKLPVTITAVAKSKSKTKQTIKIKTAPGSPVEVTIAVVDEGIMQLKNSVTPDPYEFFYQKRALTVDGYDIYPLLLPDVRTSSSIAGDGYDLQKRVNPLTNKRVKLVALWSGILKTNSDGEASYTINIPQFSGDLRVMAAAWRNSSFGSAEQHIKVADPVVISTSMPRFLSPRDTLYIPVTLTNTTQGDLKVRTTLSFTGGLSPVGSVDANLDLPAGKESQFIFKALSASVIGDASVTSTVKSGNDIYTEKTDITIRPPASLQKVSDGGEIKGGATTALDLTAAFMPSSMDASIVFSRSPVAKFSDQMSYLLDYPHGCVEQTTSIAFPQLYYVDLIQTIKNNPNHPVNVTANVNAAIQKLQSMQLYNGALSYWLGESTENWWGSVYAAHFLMEAQKLGYDVNTKVLNKLMDYLSKKVKEHQSETLWYYDNVGKVQQRVIPSKDVFYSLYILALNGQSDLSSMNYYKQHWNDLAIDSRYLLAVTYLACGDRKNYDLLLPKQFEGEKSLNSFGGSFYSYIRDEALAMNALLSVDPENVQLIAMAQRLSKAMSTSYYLNTQERAFVFLALGKFLKKNGNSTVTATITDTKGKKYSFKGNDLSLKKLPPGKITINTTGSGSLYYSWTVEGLTKDGSYKEEDSNLRIRRSYLDRFGKPITGNTFHQNDLIVIKLTLENNARNTVENIVITDMLPAGFEIENPRVSAVPELEWIKDNTYPEHMDIRDDRINLFTTVGYKPQNYYYLVRAVSTGNFVVGPASADAMYNGEYHSYNGAGRIRIINN
ncbi:MAG: alpha-2-macroglobulin [Bacteroidota bacterium]